MAMNPGIYSITNTFNGMRYIGYSTNIDRRLLKHQSFLISNIHWNLYLQNSWNKYGSKNFKFEILEETTKLEEREIYYISLYDSYKFGYNQTLGGDGGDTFSFASKKRQEERARRISEGNKGKICSDTKKAKLAQWNTGRKMSDEAKKKMSAAKKDKKLSIEHRKKLSESNRSKDPEVRKKLSEAAKKQWAEKREEMIVAMRSRKEND